MIRVAIAGFHKCGTSSLFEMLGRHPDLCAQNVGQPPHFLHSDAFREDFEEIRRTCFPHCPEASGLLLRDNRLAQDAEAVGRLRELSPDATLVFLVRDPVARAYSAYWHAVERGFEQRLSFDDVVRLGLDRDEGSAEVPLQRYLSMGLYHRQLRAIEAAFPRDQIVIIDLAHLQESPQEACGQVFRAAGLHDFQVPEVHRNQATAFRSRRLGQLARAEGRAKRGLRRVLPARLHRAGGRFLNSVNTVERPRPPMSQEHREALTTLYAEENLALWEDYGISFQARG